MMDGIVFQRVYEALAPLLPPWWQKVILRAAYTEGSYSIQYYVAGPDGKPADCRSLPGTSEAQRLRTFSAIHKILAEARRDLAGKDRWSVLTMVFDQSGAFQTDFCYEDIGETFPAFLEAWERRYLNPR